MKKYFATMLLVSMLLAALVPAVALGSAPASGRLMLYSSLPALQLDLMVDMFNEKYPNITVDVFPPARCLPVHRQRPAHPAAWCWAAA